MKILKLAHLTFFCPFNFTPSNSKIVIEKFQLPNNIQKKEYSENFQCHHNISLYERNILIEVTSYSDEVKNCSKCESSIESLDLARNLINISNFDLEFRNKFKLFFNIEMDGSQTLPISNGVFKNSIYLTDLESTSLFQTHLDKHGIVAIAIYVRELMEDELTSSSLISGVESCSEIFNVLIKDQEFRVAFVKLDGVLIELLERI